jgi:cation transport ATPase
MLKCELCDKKIGLLAVRYTWLDKENNRAMHDKCYTKYKNESPEKRKQISKEEQDQNENKKTLNKMKKSRIFGGIILILAISLTLFAVYGLVAFGIGFSIYSTVLFLCSYLVGIELIRIKKEGWYHKLILIFGVIITMLYTIILVSTAIVVFNPL